MTRQPTRRPARPRTVYAVALLVTLLLAGVVSSLASSSPDGLERVGEDTGFGATARQHDLEDSPLAGYGVAGIENVQVSGGLAGVIGVGLTLAIGSGLFLVLRRRGGAGATPASDSSATDSSAPGSPAAGTTD